MGNPGDRRLVLFMLIKNKRMNKVVTSSAKDIGRQTEMLNLPVSEVYQETHSVETIGSS